MTSRQLRAPGARALGVLVAAVVLAGLVPARVAVADGNEAPGNPAAYRSISAGSGFTCAVLAGGVVKCWGLNNLGQLGLGDRVDRGDGPREMGDALPGVDLGTGRSATAVSAGGQHTCALLDGGAVKCWGSNRSGQLGLGNNENHGGSSFEPMGDGLPEVDLGSGRTATAIAAGDRHTCALLDDHSIKCWGANSYGQLGLGDVEPRGDEPGEMGDDLPAVDLGSGRTAVAVAAGGSPDFGASVGQTCALLDDATVKCWGANLQGQAGRGTMLTGGDEPGEMGDDLPPVDLGAGRTATALTSDGSHACALLDDATVKCWGLNSGGELGLGDSLGRGDGPGEMGDTLPVVDLGAGRTATSISAGGGHTCAVLDDGSVRCWGSRALGLGVGAPRGDEPGEMGAALPGVDLGTGRTAVAVTTGTTQTCATLDDGTLRCWGGNDRGELGLGDTQNRGDHPGEMGDALPVVVLDDGASGAIVTYEDPAHHVSGPTDIVAGPDGGLWFTSTGSDRIGRIDPTTGAIVTFGAQSPNIDEPHHLALGADGNLWFTNLGSDRIGRIDPDTGAITAFVDPSGEIDGPLDIARVRQNMWFSTSSGRIGRIKPDGTINSYELNIDASGPIAADHAGDLWIADDNDHGFAGVCRVKPRTRAVQCFDGGGATWGQAITALAAAPDGAIWMARNVSATGPLEPGHNLFSRLDPTTGAVEQRGSLAIWQPVSGLTPGPGGSMWATVSPADRIARITATGRVTSYTDARLLGPVGIAAGPDGALWFASTENDRIGRIDPTGPEVDVVVSGTGAVAGHPLHFSVTAVNAGTVPLTGVVVTDADAPGCAGTLGDLAVGQDVTVTCEVPTTPDEYGDSRTNTATVDADQTYPASASATVSITGHPDLAVTLDASPATVLVGHPVHFEAIVTNTGEIDLADVTLTDAAAPECDQAVGALAAGVSVVVDCAHLVTAADVGSFDNQVTVDSDLTGAEESDTVTVDVVDEIASAGFTDVPHDAAYARAVDWAKFFAVIAGFPDNSFRPSQVVTRGPAARMLWQMMDHPAGSPPSGFPDVSPTARYAAALDWARAAGVADGDATGAYRPLKPLKRSQLVVMLWRMVGAPTGAPDHGYDDVPATAGYGPAVRWARANGLLDHVAPGDRFDPTRAVRRRDIADVLYQLALNAEAWPQGPDDPVPPSTVLF